MNGINPKQLRELVIRPALELVGMYSPAAEQLVLGTACHESECGQWLRQIGGPALGVYQMEPATHNDIVTHYLMADADRYNSVLKTIGGGHFYPERLVFDLRYATVFCRLHYRRASAPLPEAHCWDDIAAYWKSHYNTKLGKGKPEQFLAACRRFGVMDLA